MSADENNNSGNQRRMVKNPGVPPSQTTEQEQIPCPRCDSTNTKFCYYNNYNYSQPRHFCKACRRYWTHGGTLRDIPVGGGTRKSAKRSRTNTTTVGSAVSASMSHEYPLTATPVLLPFQGTSAQFCGGMDVKGSNGNAGVGSGSFTSLLSNQTGPGFLALGGFGLGLEPGYVGEMGLGGLGRGVWGFTGLGDGGAGVAVNNGGGGGNGMGNTWQFESNGETGIGFNGGDCFSWPDLAISTPGNGLK